jgi:hypothetical protein
MKKLTFLFVASLAFASCSDELGLQPEEKNVATKLNIDEDLSSGTINKNWAFPVNFNKGFGEQKGDSVANAIATSDGGTLIVGHTSSTVNLPSVDNSRDALIIKLNAAGEQVWSIRRDYNNLNKMDDARGVLEISDGYLVSGFSFLGGGGVIISWILKVDVNGNYTIFSEEGGQVNDNNIFVWNSIVPSYNGGYVLSGTTNPGIVNAGPGYLFLREVDNQGNTIDEKSFITPGQQRRAKRSEILKVPDGYLVITPINLLKFGTDIDNLSWTRGSNFSGTFKNAAIQPEGDIILLEVFPLNGDHKFSRLSSANGDEIGAVSYLPSIVGDNVTTINDLDVKSNGNVFIVGNRKNTSNNVSSAWLAELTLTPQVTTIVGQKFWASTTTNSLNQFTQIEGRSTFSDPLTDNFRLVGHITSPGQNIPSHNGALDIWAMGIQF